ncbi:hypothetical protein [Paenarthrobacter sp. YJN-5]|uniref:hypothetical protein n=1 Tax=Paenarthrobacter sp. YJN-5 TaxID=2735316 RepID=UPI001877AB6A|nr:hypothetical protein [Paenarthrobacter sp. YJN-5]QOT19362.1 hypothetical protein HMI59_22155 [Paenarthrobacter sp. YJN-5]
MGFQDDFEQQLAAARQEDSQRALAAERSVPLALQALNRLQTKCSEAAKFLLSQRVPAAPIIEEEFKQTFWAGQKKLQRKLAEGWPMEPRFGLAISSDGRLWQTTHRYVDRDRVTVSAPFYFSKMRENILANQAIEAPLGGLTLVFPYISWYAATGFVGEEDTNIKIYGDDPEAGRADLDASIEQSVIALTRKGGPP